MNEQQYIEHIEQLSRALNDCYTDQGACCVVHDDKDMMRRRLVEINRVVCAALNTQ